MFRITFKVDDHGQSEQKITSWLCDNVWSSLQWNPQDVFVPGDIPEARSRQRYCDLLAGWSNTALLRCFAQLVPLLLPWIQVHLPSYGPPLVCTFSRPNSFGLFSVGIPKGCFFSSRHFGHLSHSCIKTPRNRAFSPYFQTFWPKWVNFFRSFQNHFGLWPKNYQLKRQGNNPPRIDALKNNIRMEISREFPMRCWTGSLQTSTWGQPQWFSTKEFGSSTL